nr:hypothetical protein TDPV-304 [Oriental turtle dovepox virus]
MFLYLIQSFRHSSSFIEIFINIGVTTIKIIIPSAVK